MPLREACEVRQDSMPCMLIAFMLSRTRDRYSMLASISSVIRSMPMYRPRIVPSVKLWSRRQEMHACAHMSRDLVSLSRAWHCR